MHPCSRRYGARQGGPIVSCVSLQMGCSHSSWRSLPLIFSRHSLDMFGHRMLMVWALSLPWCLPSSRSDALALPTYAYMLQSCANVYIHIHIYIYIYIYVCVCVLCVSTCVFVCIEVQAVIIRCCLPVTNTQKFKLLSFALLYYVHLACTGLFPTHLHIYIYKRNIHAYIHTSFVHTPLPHPDAPAPLFYSMAICWAIRSFRSWRRGLESALANSTHSWQTLSTSSFR